MNIKIKGIGNYIPEITVKNTDFNKHVFLNEDGSDFDYPNDVVISKFKFITGIGERRYAAPELNSSDLGFLLLKEQLKMLKLIPKLSTILFLLTILAT